MQMNSDWNLICKRTSDRSLENELQICRNRMQMNSKLKLCKWTSDWLKHTQFFCDMQRKEIEKARQLIDHSKKDIKSCIVNQNNWYPCGITPYGSTVMEYQNEQQKTAAGRQNDPIFQVSWSIASCFKEYVHTTLQDDQSVAQGNVVWYVCHLNCKIYYKFMHCRIDDIYLGFNNYLCACIHT